MILTKEDVEFHSDGFAPARPAVNVKVHGSIWDVKLPNEEYNPHFTHEWIEQHVSDDLLEAVFSSQCEWAWEDLQGFAEEVWPDRKVKVYSEGRSSGWAVVDGISDFEDWDAIDLAKWRKFARYARTLADDIPAQMISSLAINEFDAWVTA